MLPVGAGPLTVVAITTFNVSDEVAGIAFKRRRKGRCRSTLRDRHRRGGRGRSREVPVSCIDRGDGVGSQRQRAALNRSSSGSRSQGRRCSRSADQGSRGHLGRSCKEINGTARADGVGLRGNRNGKGYGLRREDRSSRRGDRRSGGSLRDGDDRDWGCRSGVVAIAVVHNRDVVSAETEGAAQNGNRRRSARGCQPT